MIVHSFRLHPGIISVTRVIHISSVHLRPQTNQDKLSVTTDKVESIRRFFFFPSGTFVLRVFNTPFHFLLHDNLSITVDFYFSYTFSSSLQLWAQEAITRDRAHHKVFLAEQLVESLLQFCFLLRWFLQGVQGLLLKFSLQGSANLLPWVHHPLEGGKRKKRWLSLRFHLVLLLFDWLLVYYIHLHHTLDIGGTLHFVIKSKYTHPSKPAIDWIVPALSKRHGQN